ncbi:hypothetical protein N9891_00045 [bacterium]|nr:hypothetical protein [bacterium]
MAKQLINSYFGAIGVFFIMLLSTHGQGYLEHFDPDKGFGKPEKSLTTIFLKLAGSLEHHGSPEPYIRWMMARYDEHEGKQKAKGKKGIARPDYLTDGYVKKLLASWKTMEKPLQLKELCHLSGRYMRHSIQGSWHKTGEDWALEEPNLKGREREMFVTLSGKDFFTKADFPMMAEFYEDGGGFDKLGEQSKKRLSTLNWRGQMPKAKRDQELALFQGGTKIIGLLNEYQEAWPESAMKKGEGGISSDNLEQLLTDHLGIGRNMPNLAKRPWDDKDSVRYAHEIQTLFLNRFEVLDEHVGGTGAPKFKKSLRLMIENLLVLANSELHLSTFKY